MRRRLVLIAAVSTAVSIALAACSSSSKSAAPTTTTAATKNPSTTVSTGTPVSTTAAATTVPPTAATTETSIAATTKESVFVLSVDLTAHTITVDPMEFLTGQAAVTAFKQANPNATGGPDNDYYIVNPTKDHVVLPFATDAIVRVVQAGGTVHTDPAPVSQATLVHYPALALHPFWITVVRGSVTEVDEQFVP